MAMIAAWVGGIDADMAAALPAQRLAAMKIRERIRALVLFRLEAAAANRESLRRALAIMAMPQNAPRALVLGWSSADLMWRLAGDTATDYNHYTKRLTLGALYAATLAVFADDDSEDFAETRAFLERRIDGVMKFEAAKARWMKPGEVGFSPARFLGRLRYPAG
jgi:ubiquinone biosynthesis protein COQ9